MADVYSAYLDTSGSWIYSNDSKSVKIPCDSGVQYTLTVSNSLAIFRIYESSNQDIIPRYPEDVPIRLTEIYRGTNTSRYTFTTSSTAKVIVFQGSASAYDEWFNSLMLVEGSTAPSEYHPYYEWVN